MVAYVPPKQAGKYKAVASGAITNGKPVVVNSTGTVTQISESTSAVGAEAVFESAVTQYIASTFDSSNNKVVIAYRDRGNSDYGTSIVATIDSSNNTISYGSPTVFNSANSLYISPVFDSSNNKVVIAYQNGGDSSHGYAIVGTVSGTSISFGTHAEFENAVANYISATFDSSNNRVVIAYQDAGNGGDGTAIVGTVSGTSISFGSAAVFDTDSTEYISSTFDSSNNKVVISYKDGDDNHGNSIVGTVSSTSISFGTAATFESDSTNFTSTTFDSSNNKVVVAYTDSGNSNYGTAVVGTVSSTSISFGTPVIFESAYYIATNRASTFDSTNNKVIIAYQDGGNSNKGTVIEGTVSGTGISFATAILFNDADTDEHTSVIYDSNSNRSLIGFHDNGNSSYGTGVVYKTSVPTNITSENYIGIASGGTYADTAEATIDVVGTVNKDQTGLTAGQTYFVQTDGTLGTTADDPSVVAGTAISATELIVKG
jgi:hypothetical protein